MEIEDVGDEWEMNNGLWWHQCEEGAGWVYQTSEKQRDVGIKVVEGGYLLDVEHHVRCRGCGKVMVYEDSMLSSGGKHSRQT